MRMGKNRSKEIVEIGEQVLAKIARRRHSNGEQALQTRWKEAVWVVMSNMSNDEEETEGSLVGRYAQFGDDRHAK